MPKLEGLGEKQRKMLQEWPCDEHEETPWTPMCKPLADSKVALVTTAGLHIRGDMPFVVDGKGGDTSYRVIPRNTAAKDILQSHTSIGFDRTTTYRDLNIVFPIDRLDELEKRGEIGSLAHNYYSYMGALRDLTGINDKSGPEVARRLKLEGVEVVLLTPT